MSIRQVEFALARTARYAVSGAPPAEVREAWMVCHGYGQLAAQFLEDFEGLDDGRRLFVAPEGLSRFYLDAFGSGGRSAKVGASWMTREGRESEIDDYVRLLEAVRGQVLAPLGRAVPLGALGFSQGGATVARWVARTASRPRMLILWGAALPPELAEDAAGASAFAGVRVLLVAGEEDSYVDRGALDTQAAALQAQGVSCRRVAYPGGHRLESGTLRQLLGELAGAA